MTSFAACSSKRSPGLTYWERERWRLKSLLSMIVGEQFYVPDYPEVLAKLIDDCLSVLHLRSRGTMFKQDDGAMVCVFNTFIHPA